MESIYKRKYFISANEGNPEGELALTILVSNIIEVATAHANALGIGNPDMEELNAGWVLSRLTVEMKKFPAVNTDYIIETWVEDWNRHFSTRDFRILDSEGNVLGYARSIWMVLDTVSHENFGLSHLSLPAEAIQKDKECPIDRQRKHLTIVESTDENAANASTVIATAPAVLYRFRYNDIDFYRHVNTVRYIALLLNQFSLEEFDRNAPTRLEIAFLHEGKYGDTVKILRHDNPTSGLHEFTLTDLSKEGNPTILFARLGLTPRDTLL